MNLYIGGGSEKANNNPISTGEITYEQLIAVPQYLQNEIRTDDAYDLSLLLSSQLSELDIRSSRSEFNANNSMAPRRGVMNYNGLIDNGKTWFRVEFQETDDLLVVEAELAFINFRSGEYSNINRENVWMTLQPSSESTTTKDAWFNTYSSNSTTVGVALIYGGGANLFSYVLTPVGYIGNVPLRFIVSD